MRGKIMERDPCVLAPVGLDAKSWCVLGVDGGDVSSMLD